MIYDLIIIGAGAAGLFASAYLSQIAPSVKVLLLEKTGKPGAKLLMSGSGQCNFTHNENPEDFIKHFGDNGKSLKHVLYNLTAENLMTWMDNLGIHSLIRDDLKVFPASLKAQDILDALLKQAGKGNFELKLNQNILSITAFDHFFSIKTSRTSYQCKKLLMATGGLSYPVTGSDGSSYPIIESLGHKMDPLKPSLCPPVIKNYNYKALTGISFSDIAMTLIKKEGKKKHFRGDMLFTHFSVSGPLILDASRYYESGDLLAFNFTPFSRYETFVDDFVKLLKKNPRKIIKNILSFYPIPQALILVVMSELNMPASSDFFETSRKKTDKLLHRLYHFELEIESPGSYKMAMATTGGVSLKEINMKTMESKLCKDLYFAGEVINADGDTGGYNIHAAFAEAKTAVDHIVKFL